MEKINKIVNKIKHEYPKSKIVVSGLLPRKDLLNHRVGPINNKIKELMQNRENLTFVEHNEVENTTIYLYDKKHLNNKGVKIFAKNLKKGYFKSKMTKEHPSSEQENQNHAKRYTDRNLHNTYQQQPKINPRNSNGPHGRLHSLMENQIQERNHAYNKQHRMNNHNKPGYNHLHSKLMNLI